MNWIQKNFRTIIYISFLVPILTVAFVSISHVTSWYGLSNPLSWAIYLSVGIEIAALSALAAISAPEGGVAAVNVGGVLSPSSSSPPPQPTIIKTIKAAVNKAENLSNFFITFTPYFKAFVTLHSKLRKPIDLPY